MIYLKLSLKPVKIKQGCVNDRAQVSKNLIKSVKAIWAAVSSGLCVHLQLVSFFVEASTS